MHRGMMNVGLVTLWDLPTFKSFCHQPCYGSRVESHYFKIPIPSLMQRFEIFFPIVKLHWRNFLRIITLKDRRVFYISNCLFQFFFQILFLVRFDILSSIFNIRGTTLRNPVVIYQQSMMLRSDVSRDFYDIRGHYAAVFFFNINI